MRSLPNGANDLARALNICQLCLGDLVPRPDLGRNALYCAQCDAQPVTGMHPVASVGIARSGRGHGRLPATGQAA